MTIDKIKKILADTLDVNEEEISTFSLKTLD